MPLGNAEDPSDRPPEEAPSRDSGATGLGALLQRHGVTLALVIGAVVLFTGLGRSGLWEPWEMDRADLARTLVEPGQVVVALGEGTDALRESIDAAAAEAGLVARHADPPGPGLVGVAAGPRTIREALDRARTDVVRGLILDASLVGASRSEGPSWPIAWRHLSEGLSYIPNGHVVLLLGEGGPDVPTAHRELAVARLTAAAEQARNAGHLDAFTMPPASDSGWDPFVGEDALPDRLVLVQAPGPEATAELLEDAASAGSAIVQFKDHGKTRALAPLDHWATATLYAVFGISETTSRLGGALLAFLALLATVFAVRRHWDGRTALFAGIVLATTPLFFGQARSVAGDPGFLLATTLFGVGLLDHTVRPRALATWAFLVGGALVGFFALGLGALLVFAAIATGAALVTMRREPIAWAPSAAILLALGLAAAWVLTQPADSFAGQFRFTQPLFTDGPSAYERNFDFAIKRIGFGTFPWSAFMVVAFGALAWRAPRDGDARGVVLVLWLAVPAIAVMGLFKDFNFAHYPAVPAMAVGIALMLDQMVRRGIWSAVTALFVLFASFIIFRELSTSPEPLADLLAFDPPFSDKPGQRFPDEVKLSRPFMLVTFALLVLAVAHMTRLASGLGRVAATFRRPTPFGLATGGALFVLPLMWFVRVLGKYQVGMKLQAADALSDGQRHFASRFLLSADPAVLMAWIALALVVGTLLIRYVGPALGAWFGRTFRTDNPPGFPLSLGRYVLVGLFVLFRTLLYVPLAFVGRLIGRALSAVPPLLAHRVGAALSVILAIVLLASVSAPEGYWQETHSHIAMLGLLALAAAAAFTARRLGASRFDATLAAVAVLAFALATRLSRDAELRTWLTTGLVLLIALAWARLAVPRMARSARDLGLTGGAMASGALFALTLPLLHRWDHMGPLLYPEGAENLTRYLLVGSRTTALVAVAIVGLVANAWLPRAWTLKLGRTLLPLERGSVAVGGLLIAGLVFAGVAAAAFYPMMSEHVSQKHIIDSYREAEGLAGREMGDRIFKHGSFGATGRKDSNFYTAKVPEIRDRTTALETLLGREDRVVSIETAAGTKVRVLPGWDGANDADGDGRRDAVAVRGVATETGPGRLVDSTKAWTPGALAGHVLVDSSGRHWTVTGNDATSLTLDSQLVPAFSSANAERNAYVVDAPHLTNHRATAETRDRLYMLLPTEGFSDLNHAFRKKSDGAHIPVLDGRSSRVLLASSWLSTDEENDNRYAQHTMTRAEFDALADPKIHRGWGNYEDKIRVLGYRLDEEIVSKGKTFRLQIYFEALTDMRTSYKIFMHLDRTGTSNRIHGDHWPLNLASGEEEGKTCVGCYRTDHWLPGDVVVDVYEGEVPIGTPSGPQDIWLGFFSPGSDKRLKAKSWEEGRVRHDGQNRLRLGSLQVR